MKAHTLDLSHATGRLLSAEDGARHWFETVYRPVLEVADGSSASRLLESTTGPDRFLLFRRGFYAPLDPDWQIPASFVERGRANLAGGTPSAWSTMRGARRRAELLPTEGEEPPTG